MYFFKISCAVTHVTKCIAGHSFSNQHTDTNIWYPITMDFNQFCYVCSIVAKNLKCKVFRVFPKTPSNLNRQFDHKNILDLEFLATILHTFQKWLKSTMVGFQACVGLRKNDSLFLRRGFTLSPFKFKWCLSNREMFLVLSIKHY